MKSPSVLKYAECSLFFRDFVLENRKTTPGFTYDYFGKELGWPRTLLNDLEKKRKPLSIRRAVEFSQYMKFDPIQAEHLILLALSSSTEPAVKDYFSDLAQSFKEIPKIYSAASESQARNFHLTAVFSVLRWSGVMLSTNQLLELMQGFPEISKQKISSAVAELKQNNFIKEHESAKLSFPKGKIFFDEREGKGRDTHAYYSQNFLNYIEKRIPGRASMHSIFVCIKKEDFNIVEAKIMKHRNWIYSLDNKYNAAVEDPEKYLLCQFDSNIFSVIDTRLARQRPSAF